MWLYARFWCVRSGVALGDGMHRRHVRDRRGVGACVSSCDVVCRRVCGVRKSPRARREADCRSCFESWAQPWGWHTHATRAHGRAFVCIAAHMSAAVMRGVVSASR